MNTGKQLRLRNIWKHERAVIVPFDHGGYSGPVAGIEDPRKLTEQIAKTGADAILVSPGVLAAVAGVTGDLGIIVRLDGAVTSLGGDPGDYRTMLTVEQALRIGADAGIVFTFAGTRFESESIQRLAQTAERAYAWGLPLICEVLAPGQLNDHFGSPKFSPPGKKHDIEAEAKTVTRVCAEAGADIIKTRYTGDVKKFAGIVQSTGAPIIVAGGPAAGGDDALLQLTHDVVDAGAAGVIFGRNVWQHPHVEKLVRALCAVVHDGEAVSVARKLLT
jgi:fructose-bisphosphate aldolase / 2-amino-3,7-dideoxy-D-threo-hept-6-ulosonate synthase